jgi:acyl-CoA dehydrogenase
MTAMDHLNPETYSFDDYLSAVSDDWLADDELLQAWLARSNLDVATQALVESFGRRVATLYREIADVVEQGQNLPYLATRDPYNRRHADVVIPAETWNVLGDVHGSGIWKAGMDERARYAIVYLLNQNGEFGVTCSTACTDGMARIMRAFPDDPRTREVIALLENATPDAWIHGAQFVTEIQGGSDAATNAVCAEPMEEGLYAISGQKWFCSNLTADYWMVTARIDGAEPGHRGVSLFCVPREWEGQANGWSIVRLKDKVGTRALPTAEIDLSDALGWPVGALDAGLKNTVATVLTTSRIHNAVAAASGARSSVRLARAYAEFRRAFAKKLADHTLIAASLRELEAAADRTAAGAFATVDVWTDAMANPGDDVLRSWARILVSLAKAVTSRTGNARVYNAMMIFGGNGIEERFSAMPRLWRDAAILETWEGSYSLLLMQALGDLVKFGVAGREAEFLGYGLGDFAKATDIAELGEILRAPDVDANIERWGELGPRLYHCFEQRALSELRG